MTNIKKILATTLSILVVTSGSMATNAMVAVPNVPHQPFMPPIVGVPTVNSGQLSFKSIKTQIANFFSLSSKTDGQLKNTENLYSDESEEIGGQWEDRNKKVYDDIQWKFNPKNGTLTVTGTGEIPFMNCFTVDCLPRLWESQKIADQIKTLVIGEGITKVGDCAFCYLVSLQKVRLPKSVNHIDNHAFYGCTSLTEINLEDSNLTKMGYAALGSCNLSKIKLPSSLKEVGEKVFTGNSNLKEVKFCGTASPAYEKAAFDGCVNLTDVKVPEGYKGSQFCEKSVDCALNGNCKIGGSCGENMSWELDDGTLNITGTGEMNSYDASYGPWIDYRDEITNVTISDGVESIGTHAFNECHKLARVRLPEGLKSIGAAAFHNCPIKNLSIPNTVVNIGAASFCAHESETMELPSCVQTDGLGVLGGLSGKYLKNFTLKSCSNNETPALKVEDGVLYSADGTELIAYPTAKEDRVFEIPELVEKIHSGAFRGCNNLKKLIIPKSIIIDGGLTFNDASFDLFYCGDSAPEYRIQAGRPAFESTNVTVYLSKKYPNTENFCGSSAGKRVLNENCKIGGSCGENISWELDYDGTLNITGTGEMNSYGLLDSPWSKYRDEITNVIIEDGVESIGSYAFNECNKLAKVRLPEGLKSIGVAAFHDCPIKNLYIPNTVVTIEPSSFYSHESETMELPSCVQTDGLGVLGGLSGKYLKNFTLKSCSNNETPALKVEDGVLYSADGTELIAYPTAKEDRVFEIPELVEKIHSGAFRGCNNLKKLIIPKSIIIDGGLTFNDASFDLFYCGDSAPEYRIQAGRPAFESTNVTVYLSKKYPNTENFCGSSAGKRVLNENCKIGDSCGENMLWELDYDGTLNITGTGEMNSYGIGNRPWEDYKDEITNVIIGDGVESIGSYAFEGCVNLQNVNISESVGQIGSGAFNNCMSLTNVNFNGLSDPGCSNSFEDCGKLESVNVPECYENNTFCGKNVSKILDHVNCTEPESSSSMESSQSSSESSSSMESSQSSSKLSSSTISEVNLGSKRIELIFSKEDIQISSAEESIKDIIDLDPGQYKITVKVIDDEEVKVTVQFVNEDDLNEFHKKVSECTK